MRRSVRILGTLLALALSWPGGAAATGTPRITATLDGRTIDPTTVGTLHCHDLEHPVIRCYRSEARLAKAYRRSVAGRLGRPGSNRIAAVAYVRIYEHAFYEGASVYLSVSYANLGSIGWNDRITSYKSVNGGSGTFWHHANQGGTDVDFCCNTNVTNVGSSNNDAFSSVSGSA